MLYKRVMILGLRFMRSKGQINTIEALISIAIIGVIIFLLYFRAPVSIEVTQLNQKLDAYNALKILDQTQNLRYYALQKNATKIEELLLPFLKSNYKVALFNRTSNITEIPEIDAKNIAVLSYFIAGDVANYQPIEIRVYLW